VQIFFHFNLFLLFCHHIVFVASEYGPQRGSEVVTPNMPLGHKDHFELKAIDIAAMKKALFLPCGGVPVSFSQTLDSLAQINEEDISSSLLK
jgi:hypothetical protein